MERQNRLLLVLSIAFLVLVAVVVLGKDGPKRTLPEDGAPARRDLFDYKDEDIESVTLKHGTDEVRLTKQEGTWKMTAPKEILVDSTRVTDIVQRFGTLEVEERDIQGKAEDFGLDPATRVELTLGAAGGKNYTVFLGKDTTVGYATYLQQKEGGAVELAASKVGDLIHRSADDFRSKDVWDFSSATARRIRIEAGGAATVLRKDDHGWWVGDTGPRADQKAVEAWLNDARSLRVDRFLDGADPVASGVEPPAASVTIEDDGGTRSLSFGPTAEDGVTARTATGIVYLGKEAVKLLKLDAWTSDKLTVVRRYQVDHLEVKLGDKVLTLTRKDGQWNDAAGKPSVLGDPLLDRVEEAAADWSAPAPALTESWGRIVLGEGDTRRETILIGQELGDGRRAARDEAGGPPFAVAQSTLDTIAGGLP